MSRVTAGYTMYDHTNAHIDITIAIPVHYIQILKQARRQIAEHYSYSRVCVCLGII